MKLILRTQSLSFFISRFQEKCETILGICNNVIRFIYQVSIIGDLDLEWRVNSGRFKIIAKNLPRNFQNTVLVRETVAFIANVILHFVEIK
jgi:hypothetical protein